MRRRPGLITTALLLTLTSTIPSLPALADPTPPVDTATRDTNIHIAAGNHHTLVAREGEIWAWGYNYHHQSGYDGPSTGQPHLVGALRSDVVAVAGTLFGSLALQADGSVWAWGLAHQGPGYDYDGATPTRMAGLPPVQALATGDNHVLALSRDGKAWAWGDNNQGQLGVGDVDILVDPLEVIGLENLTAVAAGPHQSVALKADGTVWSWGNGHPDPAQIPGLTDVTAIQAGLERVVALKRDGTVWTYKDQELKQASGLTNVVAICHARGSEGILYALDQGGTLWRYSPLENLAERVPGLGRVTQLAAGDNHVVALTADGTLVTWGSNSLGQLGVGTTRPMTGLAHPVLPATPPTTSLQPVPAAATSPLHVREVNLPADTRNTSKQGAFAYNGEKYVYAGSDSIYTSVDGLNWAKVEGTYKVAWSSKSLIWDGKQWVLVTWHGLYTSSDAVHWTEHQLPDPDPQHSYWPNDVLYVNGKYYVVATPGPPRGTTGLLLLRGNGILISTDLTHWRTVIPHNIEHDLFGEIGLTSLGYNGKYFVASAVGALAFSDDGEVWEGAGGATPLTWDGTRYLWTDYYSIMAITGDRKSERLFPRRMDQPVRLERVASTGREYLAVGHNPDSDDPNLHVLYSGDGAEWNLVDLPGVHLDPGALFATPYGFLTADDERMLYLSTYDFAQPSTWAAQQIRQARAHKLVPTRLLNFYQAPISRQDVSELAVRLYEALTGKQAEPEQVNPFTDTQHPAVLQAKRLGIIAGRTATTFAPGDPVTRQDLSVVLYRTLKAAGVQVTPAQAGWAQPFADAGDVAGYAKEALQVMTRAQIIAGQGSDRLAPLGKTTREQAMVMLERAYERFKP